MAESERRLAEQEARIAEYARNYQATKLLSIRQQTMELQRGHVKMLEREIESAEGS